MDNEYLDTAFDRVIDSCSLVASVALAVAVVCYRALC